METKDMANKENEYDHHNYLIVNYFTSNLNEDEMTELQTWLNVDKANKKYFDECREIWLAGKLDFAKSNFNTNDAFSRFKQKTEQLETESDKDFRGLYRNLSVSILRIAAIIVIAFLTGFFIRSFFKDPSTPLLTYQEITVPAGSKTRVNLPDGTVVWLNSASKLTYSSNYNLKKREVKLEGEGYFKVAKDKSRPFVVLTSNIAVQALGTEFNVKSYPEEGIIETTLVTGSVIVNAVEGIETKNKPDLVLKPNEKLTFIKKTGKLFLESDTLNTGESISGIATDKTAKEEKPREERIFVKTIDPIPYIAWKEDKLILTGEPFEEVIPRLERWYDVTIEVKDPKILTYRLKGIFEKETLEQALEALRLASHFNYTIKKNTIEITK